MKLTLADKKRFWSKVDFSDDCWLWTAGKSHNGYGMFFMLQDGRKTMQRAHRIAYQHCFGNVPDGMLVRHSCDNPACVNPDHLLLGKASDNSCDMVKRGRSQKGESHSQAKLTESDIREIRCMHHIAVEIPSRQVAAMYGVSPRTIRDVRSRRSWAHL